MDATPSAEVIVRAMGVALSTENTDTCAPGTAAECGSTTLILRSTAIADAERSVSKTKGRSTRMQSSLTRERDCWDDGSHRSPGFASKDAASDFGNPAFPRERSQ